LPGQENYDAAKAVSKPPGFSFFDINILELIVMGLFDE